MRILLVYPVHRPEDKPNLMSLGLAYVARTLLDDGHKIEVLDIEGFRYSDEEVKEKIQKSNFDAVGIGGLVMVYKYLKWLVPVIKECNPSAKIVVGGSLGTSVPELILEKTQVDVCVIGEGEITAKELFRALEDGTDLSSVKGICYKKDGVIQKTPPREFIKDMDSIPFPARDLFPIENYMNPVNGCDKFGQTRPVSILGSRGCPFPCGFCYKNDGRIYRIRSPENIVEEIKMLQKNYKADHVAFLDNLLVLNKQHTHALCDLILSEGIDIGWSCTTRVDTVDEAVLKKMKQAGCIRVHYGFETGSPTILQAMKKSFTIDQVKKALKTTRKVGIKSSDSLMFGYIGETKETIQETVNFCKEIKLAGVLQFTTPFPGTPLFEQAKALGKIPQDFEKYILGLGCTEDVLSANLTDFSDSELIELRKKAMNEINSGFSPFDLELIMEHYKTYGIKSLIKKGAQKLATLVKGERLLPSRYYDAEVKNTA